MPTLSIKNSGIRNESIVSASMILVSITAITTYIGASCIVRSLISSTTEDIPLTKHCSPAMLLISLTASSEPSAEVASSKKTAIIVELSVLKKS